MITRKRIGIGVAFAVVFNVFSGCKTAAPIAIVSGRTDSVRVEYRERVDSVFVDRVRTERMAGDTLILRDSVYVYKFRNIYHADTICVRDSVPVIKEVVREVRKRNGYDRFTSCGFWSLLVLVLLVIGVRVYVKIKK